MILTLHIIIALAGLLVTGLTWVSPTKAKLQSSAGLLAATLASGTYLVVATGASLVHSCVMGLIYTGIVTVGIVAAQRKYASQHISSK